MKKASFIIIFIGSILCLVAAIIVRNFIAALWIVNALLWQWHYMKLRDLYESLYEAIQVILNHETQEQNE